VNDRERLEFIREHARALHLKGAVAQEFQSDRADGLPGRGLLKGAAAAWFLARQLWEAKPDDC
jgi:hypothetical protein